jgi:hypothetical protein
LLVGLGVAVGRASTIVVNDSGDAVHSPGCATTGLGTCSLRDAILFANANPGTDTISFSIGTGLKTIMPLTALPDISEAVLINGTTQPGFAGSPLIELDGSQVAETSDGLRIVAGGCTLRGLIINGFSGNGIALLGTGGNLIAGNYIGTNASGTSAKPNSGYGLLISASMNSIGGLMASDRNLISGNTGDGIHFTAGGNLVQGNFIGTNQAGTAALGNQNGIFVDAASDNVVGGPTASAGTPPGNLISGNRSAGIHTFVFSGSALARTFIKGNLIGTDVTGGASLGNQGDGVLLTGTGSSVIGGSLAQERNVISGNTNGVHITNAGLQASYDNVVRGNYIGTDVLGTSSLANLSSGVLLDGTYRNVIGGTMPGEGNLISGNAGNGIALDYTAGPVTENRIIGNRIGTDTSGGVALANGFAGVSLSVNGDNAVGEPGAGNTIAFNLGGGVRLSGWGDAIRGNSIFMNSGLGIDNTAGIANDTCDLDFVQNFPVLVSAVSGGLRTRVQGTLNSRPSATFELDFYASSACDPSGYGEGQRYLGSTLVTTGGDCNSSFDVSLSAQTSAGEVVTATATDEFNTTSEFSACATVKGTQFNTVAQCRVIDTRNPAGPLGGPALFGGSGRTFVIANHCGIPATASSVSANIAVTNPTAPGHLTLYPAGSSLPLASTINYRAGQTRANNTIFLLGPDGDFVVYCEQASGTVDFFLDISGYFQ